MAKPKLALIPSGYSDGRVYSVLPTNGDGDFDFSRGSNATRVNKDGLIETMPLELGSELITNGGFATDSDWTTDASWSISGGSVSCDGTQSSLAYAQQNGAIISGRIYEVTYEIKSISSGEFRVFVGNVSSEPRTSTGVYTDYITASNTSFWLRGSSTFIGSIDNVSVKEVLSGFDTPRLDYSDSSCPSLLLEPQRTNLVTYSEDFSNSSWTDSGVNITSNNSISPDGTQNADLITEDTSNGFHLIYGAGSQVLNRTDTISVYVKNVNSKYIQLTSNNTTTLATKIVFDIELGVVDSELFGNGRIENVGNGWYRLIATGVCGSSGSTGIGFRFLDNSKNEQYIGNGSSSLYLWGFQYEQSSYPTSYIPTNGTTVTRLAETASGAGNADTFNDSEGVLMVEISALADDNSFRAIAISDGSTSNRVVIDYDTDNDLRAFYAIGGGTTGRYFDINYDIKQISKVCFKYKENDFAIWVNGFELGSSNSGSVLSGSNFNNLNFNFGGSSGGEFYGNTKQIQYFDTALTDTDLEELTSWESFLDMANGQNYTIK